MRDFLQKLLNKKNVQIASFGAGNLLGNKQGILYAKKSGVECKFDFYYVKYGIVYSINAYYHYCTKEEHEKLRAMVCSYIENKPSPRDYFTIANHFGLKVDYNSYLQVLFEWMNCHNYKFYEDIRINEMPDEIPQDFLRVKDDVRLETYKWLNSTKSISEGMLYADLFVINGKVCLITGCGKSKACKAISDDEGVYDFVGFRRGENGLECKSEYDGLYHTVDYCVYMNEENFDEIHEINDYEYIQKSRENIEALGTSAFEFYSLIKESDCKLIDVPYTTTLEQKSKLLKDYI